MRFCKDTLLIVAGGKSTPRSTGAFSSCGIHRRLRNGTNLRGQFFATRSCGPWCNKLANLTGGQSGGKTGRTSGQPRRDSGKEQRPVQSCPPRARLLGISSSAESSGNAGASRVRLKVTLARRHEAKTNSSLGCVTCSARLRAPGMRGGMHA
jgi:hypothetical protein